MKSVASIFWCLVGVSVCLLAQDAASLTAIREGRRLSATVSVVAFDTNGRFLGSPSVSVFEDSDDLSNLASKFHAGVAEGVPYGMYRIEARLPGHASDTKYVWVCQSRVAVVLGLEIGLEKPIIPPTLHGRVVGSGLTPKSFVKLVGVYSNWSADSAIASDGGFDLSFPPGGRYLLLVVGEGGVLATRPISLPYSGPPIKIAVERRQPGK